MISWNSEGDYIVIYLMEFALILSIIALAVSFK